MRAILFPPPDGWHTRHPPAVQQPPVRMAIVRHKCANVLSLVIFCVLTACCLLLRLCLLTREQVIANYDPKNSEEQLALIVNNTIKNAIENIEDSQLFQEAVAIVSSVIGQVNDMTGGLICPDKASIAYIIDTNCVFDQNLGIHICSDLSTYDAMCALVANPDLSLVNENLWQTLIKAAATVVKPVFTKIKAQGVTYLNSATSSLYPAEKYMLTVPLGFAIAVAVLHSIQVGLFYIPSVTTTLIQLRTGVIPSLGDRNFQKYRVAPETVTFLTGA